MNLKQREVIQAFANAPCSERFPPLLTIDQAAELLHVPVATIYAWRSQGGMHRSCRKVGKHLRFFRGRLVLTVFNDGVAHD